MREEYGVELSSLTTMGVGGPARRLVTVSSEGELVEAVRACDEAGEPVLLLAGGSNLLISDEGFAGTVVHIATTGVEVESRTGDHVRVRVAAGESWDAVVQQAVESEWAGIECLAGIPGLAGSTPIQNVGAYGQDVSQTVRHVRVWDRAEAREEVLAAAECAFEYRHSRFKGVNRYVVLEVVFELELSKLSRPVAYTDLAHGLGVAVGDRVPLAAARESVLEQRRRRAMVYDRSDPDTWSCGSFFTNPLLSEDDFQRLAGRVADKLGPDMVPPRFEAGPGRVKSSAAWLIDRAGFGKGYGLPGPAALSSKHVLAVTNRGGARAADVIALARQVRDGVEDAFGVTLVNEPVMVGLEL